MVHAYDLPTPGDAADAAGSGSASGSDRGIAAAQVASAVLPPLLRSIMYVHPHLNTARSLLRTPSTLCVLADYTNGGSLFAMVRRGSAAGLPTAAAAFLFQQLTVTAHYGRRCGLWLHRLPPSKLLVSWNDKGMPIVKLNVIGYDWPEESKAAAEEEDVEEEEASGSGSAPMPTPAAGRGRLKATMLTPPHVLRAAVEFEEAALEEPAAAEACTVWSLTTCLHFLRRGRWPFTQDQIRRWPTTAAAEWCDDEELLGRRGHAGSNSDTGAGGPGADPVAQGMDAFEAAVFRCGRAGPAEFARSCPTLDTLMQSAWWQEGLPEGALEMTDTYAAKTDAWGSSAQLATVKGQVETLLAQARASAGCAHMQGVAARAEARVAALQLGAPPRGPRGRGRPGPNDPLRPPS